MKNAFRILVLLLICASMVPAQNSTPEQIKDPVDRGVKPQDWLDGVKGGKGAGWKIDNSVSAPMAQILQVANDALSQKEVRGDCPPAASGLAFSVIFDAYSQVGMKGLLDGLQGAIGDILTLGERKFADLLKDKGKDWLKKFILDKLSKEKPEAYVWSGAKGTCSVVLVAVWDKAAGTYEIWVYGGCSCTPQTTGTERGSIRLRTFAVYIKGRVSVDVDSTKQVPMLNVGVPTTITIEAACDPCTTRTGSSATGGKTTGGASTTPGGSTGGTSTTPQPPKADPCILKTPCKECMPLFDRIKAGCDRIMAIDRELRSLAGEKDRNAHEQATLKQETAGLKTKGAAGADALAAKGEELKELEREAKNIEIRGRSLGIERQDIEGRLKDLAEKLKECEKTLCGKGKVIELPSDEWTTPSPGAPSKPREETPKKEETPPPPGGVMKSSKTLGLVLPSDARPGDSICGTVVDDPRPYQGIPGLRVIEVTTEISQTPEGRPVLDGFTVDAGDGRLQPAGRSFTLHVPKDASSILIVLKDGPRAAGRGELNVHKTPATPPAVAFDEPPVCSSGGVQVIHGPFGGDGTHPLLEFGGKPVPIVAETPRAVFWRVPEDAPPGIMRVILREGERRVGFPLAVVALKMGADKLKLMRRESTAFFASVLGLDALPEEAWRAAPPSADLVDAADWARKAPGFTAPSSTERGVVVLILQNGSPEIVTMKGAKGETIALSFGRGDLKDGVYTYRGTLVSTQAGSFRVNGTVVACLASVAGEEMRP